MAKNEERYLLKALELEVALRACLCRYTPDSSAVEDLLQETYARLLLAAADEPEVHSIRAFALTTAHNVASDWLHSMQLTPAEPNAGVETPACRDEGEDPEQLASGDQDLHTLLREIQQLPTRCRQVLTLRKVYGYSQREIAARLRLDETAVAQDLTAAARHCAQTLFEHASLESPRLFGRLMRRRRP